MTRKLVLATAALAAAVCVAAAGPASARYVRSGLQDYANAPPTTLTKRDCRAVRKGQSRLVSEEAFRKYQARRPDCDKVRAPRRDNIGCSMVSPRTRGVVLRNWEGECRR